MSRQRISHRNLLEAVLPRHRLPDDVRALVDRALRSQLPALHEIAARRAIAALVARGILVPAGLPSRAESATERFLNRETGDTIVVRWSPPRDSRMVRLPLPPPEDAGTIRASSVSHILTLGHDFFHAEGEPPSGYGEIIDAATETVARLIEADFVTFVASRFQSNGMTEPGMALSPEHLTVIGELIAEDEHAVLYVPDVDQVPALRRLAPGPDFGAVAIATVRHATYPIPLEGFLLAWSRRRDYLDDEHLLTFALVAGQVAEAIRRAEVLERLVFYDTLTGLYNRHFFNIQMEKEMARARRAGDSFALAIADLDDFKAVNTRYGYYGGNDLLEQVARLLRSSIRPFDIVARWGGEEFALILTPPVGHEEATAVCNRIREAVGAHPYTVSGLDLTDHTITLGLSMGVAVFPDVAQTGKELWAAANTALHAAKRQGKNQVVLYTPGLGSGD